MQVDTGGQIIPGNRQGWGVGWGRHPETIRNLYQADLDAKCQKGGVTSVQALESGGGAVVFSIRH